MALLNFGFCLLVHYIFLVCHIVPLGSSFRWRIEYRVLFWRLFCINFSIWLNFHISYYHKISYPACCLAWFEIISPLRWSTFDCFFFLFLDFLFLLRLRFRFFRFLLFFLPFLDLNMFRYLFTEGSSPINFSRSSFKGGLSFKVTWFKLEPSPNRSLNLENYMIWHNRLSLGSAKKYFSGNVYLIHTNIYIPRSKICKVVWARATSILIWWRMSPCMGSG